MMAILLSEIWELSTSTFASLHHGCCYYFHHGWSQLGPTMLLQNKTIKLPMWERFWIECRKQFRVYFGFALIRSVIGWQNSRHFLKQWKANQNQSCLARPGFPALGNYDIYQYLLRVLIGSCGVCVSCDWSDKLLSFWFYARFCTSKTSENHSTQLVTSSCFMCSFFFDM